MEKTFAMIKPDAVSDRHVGGILHMIEEAGFKLSEMRLMTLTLEQAKDFYSVHRDRPFYEEMCADMCKGPVVAMTLIKTDAVAAFRTLIGATDPKQASHGTIRQKFGRSIGSNAIHGSDSLENAVVEHAFFF